MKKIKLIFPDGSVAEIDESDVPAALSAGAKRYSGESKVEKSTSMVFPDGSVADISASEVIGAEKAGAIKKKVSDTLPVNSANGAENISPSKSLLSSDPLKGTSDIYDFMANPLVTGASQRLKKDIQDGKPIDAKLVEAVKAYDRPTYDEIAKQILPIKTDFYLKTKSAENNLVGILNDRATAKSFLANFKKETGQDYTPEALAKLSPTQRINLGVAQPGDADLAAKEVIKVDLDTNFPIQQPNVFDPLIKPVEEQLKQRNEILTNPEKTADYLLRRQEQELQKESSLIPYISNTSAESMSLAGERDAAVGTPHPEYIKARSEKLGELNTVQGKINNLRTLAANVISQNVIENYLKENGIEDINSAEATDILSTKEATAKIGFRIAQKSDARLNAQLSDITSSLQGRQSTDAMGVQGLGDEAPLVQSEDDKFKSLSETGDEKIQAQLRLRGYNSAVNLFVKNGNIEAANKLLSKKDEVAAQNGKSVSDELFARLSAQRFKDNDSNTEIGLRNINAENMRTWATEAGFTAVEMSILEQHMIPDETSRTITSNFQTSGFVNNTLEALGNTAVSFKNLFRDNAARTQEVLNDNMGRLQDVGDYAPFIQELNQLTEKQKKIGLTPQELQRQQMLLDNTNLLNWWQQFKSGTGDLTGQVLAQAISAKGLDKIFKIGFLAKAGDEAAAITTAAEATGLDVAANAIAESATNSPDIIAKASKYINDNKTLFISSYANAYDGYKKESLQLMPGAENEGKRTLYATMMSTFEGLSEKIFDDRKVLSSLGKEISPVVREIVQDISKGALDKTAALGKLQSVLAGGEYKSFIKKFLTSSNQEGIEEGVMDLAGDISKAIILDQDYDITSSLSGALKTYGTMVMNGGLVAGMAARGDVRNTTFNKSTLYNIASNSVDYTDEARRLLNNGEITQNEYNSKLAITNKATEAYASMVKDGVVDKNGKNDAKNATYLLHIVNQAVNNQFADQVSDPNVKADYQEQAERSRKISEGIYKNLVNVDEFLNPIAVNDAIATELNIATPQQNVTTVVDENVNGVKQAAIDISTDEKLFNTILDTPSLTDIEKANDLQYFVDKAGENPVDAETRFGKEVADQLLAKVPTETLIDNYKFVAKVDEQSPIALRLDEIIGQRENETKPAEATTPTKNNEPLSKEAEDLLAAVDRGENPNITVGNLNKIAKDNNIDTLGTLTTGKIINALREIKRESAATTPTVSGEKETELKKAHEWWNKEFPIVEGVETKPYVFDNKEYTTVPALFSAIDKYYDTESKPTTQKEEVKPVTKPAEATTPTVNKNAVVPVEEKTFEQKVDDAAQALIDFLTPKTTKGVTANGLTTEQIVKAAAEIIKATYKTAKSVQKAIDAGIEYFKNNWDTGALGELPEDELRQKLTDDLINNDVNEVANRIKLDEINYVDAIEGKDDEFINALNAVLGSKKANSNDVGFRESVKRQKDYGISKADIIEGFESVRKLTKKQKSLIDEVFGEDAANDTAIAELQDAFNQLAKGEKPKSVLQRLTKGDVVHLVKMLSDKVNYKAISNKQLEGIADFIVDGIDLKQAEEYVNAIISNSSFDVKQLLRAKLIVALDEGGKKEQASSLVLDMADEATQAGRQTQSLSRAYEILGAKGSPAIRAAFAKKYSDSVRQRAEQMTAQLSEVLSEKELEIKALNEKIHNATQKSSFISKIKDVISNICKTRTKK